MPHSPRGYRRPNGFVAAVVLWIVGALSALISIYAVFVTDTAMGFAGYDDHLRAESFAMAALELAAYQQLSEPSRSRKSHGHFSFQLDDATVAVGYRSELARIDLNAAPKELLAGLFGVLGARADDAAHYADRIIGWRTAAPDGGGLEAAAYQKAGRPYGPRGAKFPHVNELALVLDLPSGLVARALPFLTVFSGHPQVNILDAAPEVIAALPGLPQEKLRAWLAQRQAAPENGQLLLSLLGPARTFATSESTNISRVVIDIELPNRRRASFAAVIELLDTGSEPFAVLSWRDARAGLIHE
jgi:general secretion pathway protein K